MTIMYCTQYVRSACLDTFGERVLEKRFNKYSFAPRTNLRPGEGKSDNNLTSGGVCPTHHGMNIGIPSHCTKRGFKHKEMPHSMCFGGRYLFSGGSPVGRFARLLRPSTPVWGVWKHKCFVKGAVASLARPNWQRVQYYIRSHATE